MFLSPAEVSNYMCKAVTMLEIFRLGSVDKYILKKEPFQLNNNRQITQFKNG
jgi:hypothetical protein